MFLALLCRLYLKKNLEDNYTCTRKNSSLYTFQVVSLKSNEKLSGVADLPRQAILTRQSKLGAPLLSGEAWSVAARLG